MDATQLVLAAAQAAGPCSPGEEAAWEHRVQRLAVRLGTLVPQVAQDLAVLEAAKRFPAYLEKVEVEESSRRGVLTLRPSGGGVEEIRTEQETTVRGAELIARARELTGRWVLVYRQNEPMAGGAGHHRTVRMAVHLMDLGEGALAFDVAKEIVTADAGGDAARAAAVWRESGLPMRGMIAVADLEPVRAAARERG
ncbi:MULTISPECIES: hypothetical protein [unclassified Streptomyces]|uniref:hypothetical protein n=1 Tax=unclassified Streptomyces TaxID=2593676 RepID=UPI0033B32E62